MIPVKQKSLHTTTTKGDCWRACIASILEVDIDAFSDPNNFSDWEEYSLKIITELEELGVELTVYTIHGYKGNKTPVIAVGKSPRGDFDHGVVWLDGEGIIFDPHPDNTGLENIKFFEVLTKI
jgi:hypothetical protein